MLKRSEKCNVVSAILIAILFSLVARAHEVGDAAYTLALVADYGIHKSDPWDTKPDGVFQLVRMMPGSTGWETLLTHLKQIAVHDRVIFGETEDGFFVLDANAPDAKP